MLRKSEFAVHVTCPVCEWNGDYDWWECPDCASAVLAECYGSGCINPAGLLINGVWSCMSCLPKLAPGEKTELHVVGGKYGSLQIARVMSFSHRGVGDIPMVHVVLENGMQVDIPVAEASLVVEHRTAIPAKMLGTVLWFDGYWLTRQGGKHQTAWFYPSLSGEPSEPAFRIERYPGKPARYWVVRTMEDQHHHPDKTTQIPTPTPKTVALRANRRKKTEGSGTA